MSPSEDGSPPFAQAHQYFTPPPRLDMGRRACNKGAAAAAASSRRPRATSQSRRTPTQPKEVPRMSDMTDSSTALSRSPTPSLRAMRSRAALTSSLCSSMTLPVRATTIAPPESPSKADAS